MRLHPSRVGGAARLVAVAVLACSAGTAFGASAAPAAASRPGDARREAIARAAIFEFAAGRADRAAALAAEAIARGGDGPGPTAGVPPVVALRYLRIEALLASGDATQARLERDALLGAAPRSPWARAALDLCALEDGRCAGPALEAAGAATRGPLGLAAAVAFGERLARTQGGRAAEAWGRPLEAGPAASFWLLVLAHAHLAAADTAAARGALERAVATAAGAGLDDLVSEAALRRAALAYHEGDAEQTLRWIQRVTDEQGRTLSCPGAIVTGYAYYRLGRMTEAAQAFNYAQACARDRGERGRLLALEARCRALSGDARLGAAVAGDAAQDLAAAAAGEVGTERLEDATDVLGTPLELDVDRGRLARGFFFARAAEEGWLAANAEAAGFAGFPFRVVRDLDAEDAGPAAAPAEDDAAAAARIRARAAREAAADRGRLVAMLRVDLDGLVASLAALRLPRDGGEAAAHSRRATFDAVGRTGATLEAARARADSARAAAVATRARAAAIAAAPAPTRREDRTHALARAGLAREADAREAFAARAGERAARHAPALRDSLPRVLAQAAAAALLDRQRRAGAFEIRARALLEQVGSDALLARLGEAARAAEQGADQAAHAESVTTRQRRAGHEARTAQRSALLRRRAEVDYEVALFERSAWAAIALDDRDSTESDLLPAVAASDEFLARFPASTYVPACAFNRADLEARLAVARGRAGGTAPDFAPAIARYEQLLAAHPRYRRLDAVLFNIASLERAGGFDAAADRRLGELVARAPQSELAAEAHLALGERAFEEQRYAAAEGHFAAVATKSESYAAMARYKQGYAALLRRDAVPAMAAFSALLALPGVDSSSAADGLIQLARAIRLAGPEALEGHLAAHPDVPYGFELTSLVATQEREDGAFARAARAWRFGLERWPARPEGLAFAQNVLAAWDVRARDDERIATRLDLARYFAPGGRGAAAGAPGAAFGARALLEAAFLVHERARGKADRLALERAVELYRERARLYPAADSAALAATSEGEALFDLGRFAEAARAHDRAAGQLASTVAAGSAADTLRRESAFGAALARERVAAAAAYRTPGERDTLEQSIDRFLAVAPGDPRVPPLQLSLALGSLEANDPSRARRLFERMAGRDTSEASRRSQSELGRIALAEKHWLEAEKNFATAAAAYMAAGDRAEETRLIELAASARFKQAEDLEAGGDTLGAGNDFRALADRYPGFPQADVALYRAGLAHLAAAEPRRAEEHLATLQERYPTSRLADDALLRRAEAQLAARDTAAAAATYASGAMAKPGFIAAHEEAARLWRDIGAFTDAEAEYRKLVREAPDPHVRTRALADLGGLLYQLERRSEAWEVVAPWRLGRLPAGLAADPEAEQSARFIVGRMLADSCLAIPVAHPIKPALDRKLAVLGPALDHLKAAATTTLSPYWGESGFAAGLLLDDLGSRVAALPPPSVMSAEDSAGYRAALAAQAATFYGRAEDLWIATLEGLGDLSAAVPTGDSTRVVAFARPQAGWSGRIWEHLEPRLRAHYDWRLTVEAGGLDSTAGREPPAPGLDSLVAALPGAAPDSLDAGRLEAFRNSLRWIAQFVADDQVEEAGRWCETTLKSYPDRAEIWNDAGVVRHRLGDWAGADAAWTEALRLDPRNPAALYNRAVFERFYRLDRVAARRAFERFLTLGSTFDESLADRMAEDRK